MANKLLSKDFKKNIKLNMDSITKEESIILAGKFLAELGYVSPGYESAMLKRETECNTYIGSFTALPHGSYDSYNQILESGFCILQFPKGIDYDGHLVILLIAVACKENDELQALLQVSDMLANEELRDSLLYATSVDEIIHLINEHYKIEGDL